MTTPMLTYCNPLPLPHYQRGRVAILQADDTEPAWGWQQMERNDFREMADPTVIRFDDRWWLFPSAGMLWHSTDMVNWEFQPIEPFDFGYAPTIVQWGEWLLLTACGSQMWRARHPAGPWESLGPIRNEAGEEVAWQDPALFADDDGALYCYSGLGIDGIYVVRLRADDPARWAGPRQHCFAYDPSHIWERSGEYNENIEKSFIEGAWMTRHKGKYYLQYSGPGTEWKCYAVGCYTSDSPMGPWTYQERNPILIAPRGSFVNGCGHHSMVDGPNGSLWCFYTTLVRIEHGFERRIGMDPAGFDAEGNLFVAGPTETPQLAPGVATDPLGMNGAGLLPVSVNLFARASSYAPGHEPTLAIDNEIRTWWEAAEDDSTPWLEIDLGREWSLGASRILFADRGLDYSRGIVPAPYGYLIEASFDGVSWTTLLDKRNNETEQHIVYDRLPAKPGRWVRLQITAAPAGMCVGIWEWTVFGS